MDRPKLPPTERDRFVLEVARRVCSACGGRDVDMVVSGTNGGKDLAPVIRLFSSEDEGER